MHRIVDILIQHGIVKVSQTKAATTTATADFTATFLFGNDCDRKANQRTDIGCQCAVCSGHHDHVIFAGQTGHDLHHTRIFGAGQLLHFFKELHFVCAVQGAHRIE